MPRSLVVILSALAMSAQAQDASTSEGEESQPVLASIEPAGSQRPLLPQTAPAARSDAEVDAEPPKEPNDCGIEQSLYDDQPIPVAVRLYRTAAPVASPDHAHHQQEAGELPPAVWAAGRCLKKYFIQVRSRSKEPWSIEDARLEVGNELLKVNGVHSRIKGNWSITVIVAERTKSAAMTSDAMATIHLTGRDGRVAVLQDVKLP